MCDGRGGGRWVGAQVLESFARGSRATAPSFLLVKNKGPPGMLIELPRQCTRQLSHHHGKIVTPSLLKKEGVTDQCNRSVHRDMLVFFSVAAPAAMLASVPAQPFKRFEGWLNSFHHVGDLRHLLVAHRTPWDLYAWLLRHKLRSGATRPSCACTPSVLLHHRARSAFTTSHRPRALCTPSYACGAAARASTAPRAAAWRPWPMARAWASRLADVCGTIALAMRTRPSLHAQLRVIAFRVVERGCPILFTH